MADSKQFDQWAIVEIMGHKMFAGHVTEQSIGGKQLVRIDVPQVVTDDVTIEPFTKLVGVDSIYCITPVSEDVARFKATQIREMPLASWDVKQMAEGMAKTFIQQKIPGLLPDPSRDIGYEDENNFPF